MASNNDINHHLTVSELSALLCATGDTKIPDRFIVNEAFRPSIPHQGLLPSSQLPIIDLAGALAPRSPDPERSGRRAVATALTDACKEWGFCQVVNHGVPLELLEKMASLGHDFISLPTEQKERAISSFLGGYEGRSKMVKGVGSFWLEGFTLRVAPKPSVVDFANKIWPEGNPTFCETVYKFTKEVGLLRNATFKLLAEELGLETNFFSRHFEEGGKFGTDVRVNYYPACSQPSMALGTAPHTDPTVMTILYQDSGDGLQVLAKDGSSWHLVEYKRGALIILVNDVLQAWSNGVLKAGIHRAVLNQKKKRLSFLLSTSPPPDLLIQPATLPMDGDSEHRPRYKPFYFRDYMEAIRDLGHFPPQNGRRGIDIYAGITS